MGTNIACYEKKLRGRNITVSKMAVPAGNVQSGKSAFENIVETKFREFNGVGDQYRNELEANLLGLLRTVSDAGYNIPDWQSTIEDLK